MSKSLYNSVELPALPTAHQYNEGGIKLDYAIIKYDKTNDKYTLAYTSCPLVKTSGSNAIGLKATIFPYYWYEYECKSSDLSQWEDIYSIWGKPHYENNTSADLFKIWDGDSLVWSNYDILDEDGTLYLAASEPVPVTAQNPAAMLAGFQLGAAISRMRGK